MKIVIVIQEVIYKLILLHGEITKKNRNKKFIINFKYIKNNCSLIII